MISIVFDSVARMCCSLHNVCEGVVPYSAVLAHDEDSLRKSLNCLVEWCEEWGVGINVSKCGIMHMRKKGVVRSKMSYSIYRR